MGHSRPRIQPDRVAGDKGSSSPATRPYSRERRIAAVIPTQTDEAPDRSFDRPAYRERNVVERLINLLKQWRRIATRYEKRAVDYLAMLTLATIVLWLEDRHLVGRLGGKPGRARGWKGREKFWEPTHCRPGRRPGSS